MNQLGYSGDAKLWPISDLERWLSGIWRRLAKAKWASRDPFVIRAWIPGYEWTKPAPMVPTRVTVLLRFRVLSPDDLRELTDLLQGFEWSVEAREEWAKEEHDGELVVVSVRVHHEEGVEKADSTSDFYSQSPNVTITGASSEKRRDQAGGD